MSRWLRPMADVRLVTEQEFRGLLAHVRRQQRFARQVVSELAFVSTSASAAPAGAARW